MDSIPKTSVAIILVNWNGLEFTSACLQSLRQMNFRDFEVILVDNASQNQEGKKLKNLFPEVDLIENKENLGFTGGNNVGIRKALDQDFSHVMLLNNDTVVEPDFLELMLEKFSQNPSVGIVQPLICFLDEAGKIWSAGGKWDSFLGRSITLGDRKKLGSYVVEDRKLDWATGCCMLISREAILKNGLLNEGYFAYFEDVDWSLRFRKMGFEIALASRAKIYHEAGASSKKQHDEGVLSPRVFYYHVRNQFLLLRSSGISGGFLAYLYHLGRFTGWIGYFALRGRSKKLAAVAKGIREGLSTPLQNPPTWP